MCRRELFMFQSQKTTIGQTPYAPKEDTTIHQPASMYEASKEFYRMERQKTLVAARYVRNSDPSKKDSEILKAQADALSEYAKKMAMNVLTISCMLTPFPRSNTPTGKGLDI